MLDIVTLDNGILLQIILVGKIAATALVVAPHLSVECLGQMIEIIGWNERCVSNALKLGGATCF